jgi:hypothetical protein
MSRALNHLIRTVDVERIKREIATPDYLGTVVFNESLSAAISKAYGDLRYQSNNYSITLQALLFQDRYSIADRFAEMVALVMKRNRFDQNADQCRARYFPQARIDEYNNDYNRHILFFKACQYLNGYVVPLGAENQYDLGVSSSSAAAAGGGGMSQPRGSLSIGSRARSVDNDSSSMLQGDGNNFVDFVDAMRGRGRHQFL